MGQFRWYFLVYLLLTGSAEAQEMVSALAFDRPVVVSERADGVPVYQKVILSEVFEVDQIYRSMEGPRGSHEFAIGAWDRPELVWIIGYDAVMVGADGVTEMSQEFMCHSNLFINTKRYHRRFPSGIKTQGERLFSLAQGQLSVRFPEGFGLPWMSDDPMKMDSQVLNHNFVGDPFDVRTKITVTYLRDSDLPKPLTPLVQHGVFGMKLLDGPDGYLGVPPGQANPEEHGPGCSLGETAGPGAKHGVIDDSGRNFTGFWVLAPGREVNHTLVTSMLNLPYSTKIHYISAHLHPYAESLELHDITAGKTLWKSRARNVESGIGLAEVEHFSTVEGLPVYKDHEYQLISVYNNTSGQEQDAMATMYLYFRAMDLYDFDFRPRKKTSRASDSTSRRPNFADEGATQQRVKVGSGVEYRDLVVGEGPAVKPGQIVTSHATGWLENGEKFWSSIDDGRTYDFALHTGSGGVIPGWVDGVPGMKVGGKRKLWIPAERAYGKRGFVPSVPPNSNLVFEIELFAIRDSR